MNGKSRVGGDEVIGVACIKLMFALVKNEAQTEASIRVDGVTNKSINMYINLGMKI